MSLTDATAVIDLTSAILWLLFVLGLLVLAVSALYSLRANAEYKKGPE